MRKLLTFLVVALAGAALVWVTREYVVGETVSVALPGLWTALIAVVSGAGGAALLELWLKPKRQRRNTAVVLAAEVIQNGHVLAIHAVLSLEKSPFWIPHDFRVSVVGFRAVADQISTLPADVVRRILVLYSRFDDLNQVVPRYWDASKLHSELAEDDPRRISFESYLDAVIVAFHGQMKTAFEEVKALAPMLKEIGKIRDASDAANAPDDFRERVKEHLAEREKQKAALKELRRRARESQGRSSQKRE